MVPTWLPETTKGAPSLKKTTKSKPRGLKRHPKWRPWAPGFMNVRADGFLPFLHCFSSPRTFPMYQKPHKPVVFQGFPKLVCFLFRFISKSFRFVFKPLWVTLGDEMLLAEVRISRMSKSGLCWIHKFNCVDPYWSSYYKKEFKGTNQYPVQSYPI